MLKTFLYNQIYLHVPDSWKFARHRQLHRGAIAAWADSPIVLIHIPKTAGTSFNQALGMPDLGHLTYHELHAIDPTCFNEKKKYITVIRDPLDRLRSTYRYVLKNYERKGRTNMVDIALCPSFENFLDKYMKKDRVENHFFLRPQINYLKGIPHSCLMMLNFDRLELGLRHINALLEKDLVLQRLNRSTSSSDKDIGAGDSTLERRVRDLYSEDYLLMEKFNDCDSALIIQ